MPKRKRKRPRGTTQGRSKAAIPRRIVRRLDFAISNELDEIIANNEIAGTSEGGSAGDSASDVETTYTKIKRRLLRRTDSGAELENDDNSANNTAQSSTGTECGAGKFSADQNQIQSKSEKTGQHSKRSSATPDSENHIEQPDVSRWQTHTGA